MQEEKVTPTISNTPIYSTTIVFIHGFGRDITEWNSIKRPFMKSCNICCISVTEEDYLRSTIDVSIDIDKLLINSSLGETNIILVSHSYGAFYALQLAELNKLRYNKLLLIEPTLKNEIYRSYLMERYAGEPNPINKYKVDNFDMLPEYTNIIPSIIVFIHANMKIRNGRIKEYDDILPNLERYGKICNKNAKSILVVHINKSHMLHHDVPDKIIIHIHALSSLI